MRSASQAARLESCWLRGSIKLHRGQVRRRRIQVASVQAGHQEDLPLEGARKGRASGRKACARDDVTPLRVSRRPNKAGHGATLSCDPFAARSAGVIPHSAAQDA